MNNAGPTTVIGTNTRPTQNANFRVGNGASGSTGNGGGHNHPHSRNASGSFNTSINFAVQYVDIILCSYSGT